MSPRKGQWERGETRLWGNNGPRWGPSVFKKMCFPASFIVQKIAVTEAWHLKEIPVTFLGAISL